MSGVTVETVGRRTRVWLDGRLVYDSAAQAAPCPPCRCWWARLRRRSAHVDAQHVADLLERAMADIRAGWAEAAYDAIGRALQLTGPSRGRARANAP